MKCNGKIIGCCITAFGLGIIMACLLPWIALSFALALLAVASGILLIFK